ncbi:MAG: DEAD/DEAH box helicase family protein [Candidatus Melainabacteria bacterium]|nr:MAG: DEAD/DEAH box helicase family protein [Candidatus Melainabacteria bacterium]
MLDPHDLKSKACIFVSTIQSFRVENKEGRKLYAHNENLETHFAGITNNTTFNLDRIEEGAEKGKIKFSFANLLNIHTPLVIVDEAHNNTTNLSYEVMDRVNPSCIIEFTATPSKESNVLHRVSAMELKAEEMIKLPIVLTEYPSWQESIEAAIIKRKGLEDVAKLDKDYIRPIVLIQAENKDKEITVEVIKNYLIENGKVEPGKIAIATGEQRELDGINILDPNCPIEFVITMQALKEGWDCSFAYIFCSVATVNSKTAVEQLLGRVLRMPYAKLREKSDLNKAYAFVSTTSWPNAVAKLCDNLTNMGFDETEAETSLEPIQEMLELGKNKTCKTNFYNKN